jgi:secreted PhoX family phosphatase
MPYKKNTELKRIKFFKKSNIMGNNINRRKFLGTGLAAAATVTVGNAMSSEKEFSRIPVKKSDEHPFNPVTYSAMPTHSFGKTGYKVGILSLGGSGYTRNCRQGRGIGKNHSSRHRFGNKLHRHRRIVWQGCESVKCG